jgi:hypothetical protein
MKGTTILVFSLLAVVCVGSADETTTTGVPEPPTTAAPSTTTTTEATTTTTVPEVVDGSPVTLGRRGATSGRVALAPGVYRHDLSVVPVDFTLSQPGWDVVVVADRFVAFGHQDAPLAPFVTFKPADGVDDVVAEVLGHPEVIELTASTPLDVGGAPGVVFEALFGESPVGRGGPFPCNGPALSEELAVDGGSVSSFVVGCSWNRFWIGEVGGSSVVVHVGNIEGTPDVTGSLDGLEPLIDEFLAAITFLEGS